MSKETKELREKAAGVATEARTILESITEKTTPEQAKEIEARFDKMMSDYDDLIAKSERLEKLAKAEERLSQGVHGDPRADKKADKPSDDTPSYRDAFYSMLKVGGDMAMLSTEERQVLRQGSVTIKPEERAQSVGTDAAGGFTVPVELQNILIETMKMYGPMYDNTLTNEILSSSGNNIPMPTIDDTANSAAARAENAAMVDDGSGDAVFGRKDLDAFVYATPFIRWSMELAQDSIFNMEALLGRLIGERLGRLANTQLTTGTGSGAPNGIAVAAGTGVTAVGTTAITSDEIMDLFHSVDPAYRNATPSLAYMMNDVTLKAIRKLKDGQGNYLWQMGNIQQGIPATLNGARIVINQAMPAMAATNKAVLFGDFSQYYVRKVGAPMVGVMRERFWPDLGIAGLIRFDGELGDSAAIKALTMAAV